MARRIAEGEIQVRLDDANAKAGLKEIEASTRKTMAKIDGMSADPSVDLDTAKLRAGAKWVHEEMERLDRERAHAVVTMDVRGAKKAAAEITALKAVAERLEEGYTIDIDVDRNKLGTAGRELSRVGKITSGLTDHFAQLGKTITGAGIRLGPLTLRASAFGGVLGGVVLVAMNAVLGTLAGLTASIGTGLLGVLAGATAGAGAFAFGLAGIFAIVKPLTAEMGKAFDAQKKYNKAVDTYGKDSKEAAKAMEKFKQVTGGLGAGTMEAFRAMRGLGKEWSRLTEGARKPFFSLITDGINTARQVMPLFARESVQSFKVASAVVKDWLANFRSGESQGIIKRLFDSFQSSLPNIGRGLGNLVQMFGRIADAARGMWQRFSEGFENVTREWSDFFKPSKGRDNLFAQLEASASNLFKLVGATGNLIGSFFLAGAGSGDNIVKDITDQFNEWADWLKDPKNKKALSDWIDDAFDDFKDFAGTVETIIKALGKLTDAFQKVWDAYKKIEKPLDKISDFSLIEEIDNALGEVGEIGFIDKLEKINLGEKIGGWFKDGFNALEDINLGEKIGNLFGKIRLPSIKMPSIKLPSIGKPKNVIFDLIGKIKMPKIPNVKDIFFWVIGKLRFPRIPNVKDLIFKVLGKLKMPKIPSVKDILFGVIGKLNMPSIPNIPDKFFNIIGKLKMPGKGGGVPFVPGIRQGGAVLGYAGGGVPQSDRVKRTMGERVNRAQFFAGEDGAAHPEFIIATNPMFRERNLRLLAQAARSLGAGVEGFRKGGIAHGSGRKLTRKLHDKEAAINDLETKTDQKERALNLLDLNPFTEKENADGSITIVKDSSVFATISSAWDEIIKMKTKIMQMTGALVSSIGNAITLIKERMGTIAAAEPSKMIGSGKKRRANPKHETWERLRDEYSAAYADASGMYPDWVNQPRDKFLDLAEAQKLRDAQLAEPKGQAATAGGAGGDGGQDADAAARDAYTQRQGLINETQAAINDLTLQTFRGAGDIGSGASGAFNASLGSGQAVNAMGSSAQAGSRAGGQPEFFGGGGNAIIINTLHPGDPATLSAIGNAATAGMGLQGSQSSPRFASGY